MFDRDKWLETARTATRAYAAQIRLIEDMQAHAASLLADMVTAYQWPEEADIPTRFDDYGIEEINKTAYGMDLTSELALIEKTSTTAAHYLARDVAILSYWFPHCWRKVTTGQAPLWHARRLVQPLLDYDGDACDLIDAEIAPSLGVVGVKRLTHLITATLASVDPDMVRRTTTKRSHRYVRTGGDDSDPLSGWMSARLDRADSIFLEATMDLVARRLGDEGDTHDLDHRRARALGMLANPAAIIQLIGIHTTRGMDPVPVTPEDYDVFIRHTARLVDSFTPRAHVYVHASLDTLDNADAVARMEHVGPILMDQIGMVTKGCHVNVTPVIHLDPAATMGVDAYEIPDWMRTHITLQSPYDTFPYSSIESRHLDLDHIDPYQSGVPNQTNPANLTPLSRRAHRVKTHAGWRIHQVVPGVYEWVSGAGQRVRVDIWGTHLIYDQE